MAIFVPNKYEALLAMTKGVATQFRAYDERGYFGQTDKGDALVEAAENIAAYIYGSSDEPLAKLPEDLFKQWRSPLPAGEDAEQIQEGLAALTQIAGRLREPLYAKDSAESKIAHTMLDANIDFMIGRAPNIGTVEKHPVGVVADLCRTVFDGALVPVGKLKDEMAYLSGNFSQQRGYAGTPAETEEVWLGVEKNINAIGRGIIAAA